MRFPQNKEICVKLKMDGLESRLIFEHRSESVSRKEWGRTQFLTAMRLLSSSVYHLAMYMVPFCK